MLIILCTALKKNASNAQSFMQMDLRTKKASNIQFPTSSYCHFLFQIFEKKPLQIKNFGVWLRYDSRSGSHNMYREYRDMSVSAAVTACCKLIIWLNPNKYLMRTWVMTNSRQSCVWNNSGENVNSIGLATMNLILEFNTWDFVNTRNGKNRKK